MSLLEKLAINKKITAIFVDGTSKMNLGIATVVDLLNGTERVPVQIAPVKRAERLLTDLAETSGRPEGRGRYISCAIGNGTLGGVPGTRTGCG